MVSDYLIKRRIKMAKIALKLGIKEEIPGGKEDPDGLTMGLIRARAHYDYDSWETLGDAIYNKIQTM